MPKFEETRQRPAVLLVALVAVMGSNAQAGPQRHDPSSWTLEERLEERFDPRAVEHRAGRSPDTAVAHARGFQSVDGRFDPGLFFPWELFDSLIYRAYALDSDTRDAFRVQIEENLLSAEGFEPPDGLWVRLEESARPYIEHRHEELVRGGRLADVSPAEAATLRAEIEALQESSCRRRLHAMRAVERELGEETLLRVLYHGVAPNTFIQEPIEDRSEILLFVQEGCP